MPDIVGYYPWKLKLLSEYKLREQSHDVRKFKPNGSEL